MTQLLIQTKECLKALNNFYDLMSNLGTKFERPTLRDALKFAYTESGELLDAYIRVYQSNYIRNNPKEINDDEIWMEYTQCMIMLMASLPINYLDDCNYLFIKHEVANRKNIKLTEEKILSVCVDINNLFNHVNINNVIIETSFESAITYNNISHGKMAVINSMMKQLIEHGKYEFFKKVLDKWLQNHYVKQITVFFYDEYKRPNGLPEINIDNVFDLFNEGVIKPLC